MSAFELVSILVTLTALCSYLNHRFLRLEASIGVMLMGMMIGLGVLFAGALGWPGVESARAAKPCASKVRGGRVKQGAATSWYGSRLGFPKV